VVTDAGAWIGDFSVYAAYKEAICYAFEPTKETFDVLCEASKMYREGLIIPVQKGLGDEGCDWEILLNEENSGAHSYVFQGNGSHVETIHITTIDNFVEENHLQRVDFIKADIEGAERDMLRGATKVLKIFAPKLAICT
jgi:FkbM family methyltransferase